MRVDSSGRDSTVGLLLWVALSACHDGSAVEGTGGNGDSATADAGPPGDLDASHSDVDGSVDGPMDSGLLDGGLGQGGDSSLADSGGTDALDARLPDGAVLDAADEGLAYQCGFKLDPAYPDALLAAEGVPARGGPPYPTPGPWLVGDRIVARRILLPQASTPSGFVLWSATSGERLSSDSLGDESAVDAKAGVFVTFALNRTTAGVIDSTSAQYNIRSLANGALEAAFPLAKAAWYHETGLAPDASYFYSKMDQFLHIFDRTGPLTMDVSGNYGPNVKVYPGTDGLWIGGGPAAPEIVHIPRDGGAWTTTSGVLGTFVEWLGAGRYFVTEQPGGLRRVYTRDGTRVFGPSTACNYPVVAGDDLLCWSDSSATLYALDKGGVATASLLVPSSNGPTVVTRADSGYDLGERQLEIVSRDLVLSPGPNERDGLLTDRDVLRVRVAGRTRRIGCGTILAIDAASNGFVAISTSAGVLIYDTNASAFIRWFETPLGQSLSAYANLNQQGTRMLKGTHVYQLVPDLKDLGDFATDGWSLGMNETGEYIGRVRAVTYMPDASPDFEIVKIPEGTVTLSGDIPAYGTTGFFVPYVSPSGRSVGVQARYANRTYYPIWLYHDGQLTGSNQSTVSYSYGSDPTWLDDDNLLVPPLVNWNGQVVGQERCAGPQALPGARQLLSTTDYLNGGTMCTVATDGRVPPAVRLAHGAAPTRVIGELGIYWVDGRVTASPWRAE